MMPHFNGWGFRFFSQRMNKYVFDFKKFKWAYNKLKLKIVERDMKDCGNEK